MKKFCNKIAKQQWRVTVPSINATMFRKSPLRNKGQSRNNEEKVAKRISSGSYDLQEAQLQYEKSRSLPNSFYVVDTDTSSESEDYFEDARTLSDKNSSIDSKTEEIFHDTEIYAPVNISCKSRKLDRTVNKFEYDVPKISFSFFEKEFENQNTEHENVVSNCDDFSYQTVCSTPIPVKIKILTDDVVDSIHSDNYENINLSSHKSEVKIVLTEPQQTVKTTSMSRSLSTENSVSEKVIKIKSRSLEYLPTAGIIQCGSDPLIVSNDKASDDDIYYKVPRPLKTNRLSQSLDDLDIENIHNIESTHSSVEHISSSQVIPQIPTKTCKQKIQNQSANNSESLDYCKVRSRLPLKLRRPTLLRKPKSAINSWNNFKTKFNARMAEHAAQQRVGAFDDKEKIIINFEAMYKNSKTKCKRVLKNTSRMFIKRKSEDTVDSDSSSQIVKNDAFFAKIKASDIEYKLNIDDHGDTENSSRDSCSKNKDGCRDEKHEDFDFATIRSAFRKSKYVPEGQNGFEDLRRYVKQGGDFCKELSAILQERAEAETQYAKSLSKLSSKLARACRQGIGGVNEAWKAVSAELEARAEGHRIMGNTLLEETVKPLRTLTETQHRSRKHAESIVDKAARSLSDWRTAEAKGKKHSHICARENEKLQDAAILDNNKYSKLTISRSASLIQLAHMHNKANSGSDKENAKLEGKKRKAEDAVKKADIEYYTLCVRAERSRLEWESAVLRGVDTFQTLEEERLYNLKTVLNSYLQQSSELGPRLLEATEKLNAPVSQAEPTKDLCTFANLRQSSQQVSEQLLPDFYCEHITLAMNRERRKQALVKLLHLIRQDLERERKSKNGLEKLCDAIKQTPNFGAEDSQQSVTEKLYHMKSMLTYLEGARYKVQSSLAELDSRPRSGHPLAPHITITRDKAGLQQSVLKVPQWLKEEFFETDKSPVSEKSTKSEKSDKHIETDPNPDWTDRGAADGNSNQHDSDFDEFSSQCSSSNSHECIVEELPVQPIAKCKALYLYNPNLPDELLLRPGDTIQVYRQQDDGWWLGECQGNVGIFPATYVQIISS